LSRRSLQMRPVKSSRVCGCFVNSTTSTYGRLQIGTLHNVSDSDYRRIWLDEGVPATRVLALAAQGRQLCDLKH
jgi:hypothetical protein